MGATWRLLRGWITIERHLQQTIDVLKSTWVRDLRRLVKPPLQKSPISQIYLLLAELFEASEPSQNNSFLSLILSSLSGVSYAIIITHATVISSVMQRAPNPNERTPRPYTPPSPCLVVRRYATSRKTTPSKIISDMLHPRLLPSSAPAQSAKAHAHPQQHPHSHSPILNSLDSAPP